MPPATLTPSSEARQQESLDIPIPLISGGRATLRIPIPMSPGDYALLRAMILANLDGLKGAIVKAAPAAPATGEA